MALSRLCDRVDPALEIGVRLAAHRARRGMKVSALARQVGVCASLIGQIERGPHHDRYLVRRDERAVIDVEGGVRWERLTPAPLHEVEFMEIVMEMLMLLSGRLGIFLGLERHELRAGDSVCFPSRWR